MKKAMIIFSNFNTAALGLNTQFNIDILSKEWIRNRLGIFMKYTRKSLEGQDNQNFINFIAIHPQTKDFIYECLKEYRPLPSNIIFTDNRQVEINQYIKDYDYVYLTKLDSDDMYHPTYISQLYEHKPTDSKAVIINQKGYILNDLTQEIAHYDTQSPPFYTQVFKVEDYLSVYQYYVEISHVYIYKLPYDAIANRKNFIVVAHGESTYTSFDRHKKYIITDEKEKENIKREFRLLS